MSIAAKVMSDKASPMKPSQQGVQDSLVDYYYDIMVLGRTGMGKSTTVDKLLIAKLPGMEEHPVSGPEEAIPVQSPDGWKLFCSDLIMWLISDKGSDDEHERMSVRLKNLAFFKSLKTSHLEVNLSHMSKMGVYQSTNECELFSNEITKIRVLDVPGFFGRDAARETPDGERITATKNKDVGLMRKILRIRHVHHLNFSRIVYFLPDKGCLERTSQNLIMEIETMEKYFGRAIFDSMVVVATMPSRFYTFVSDPNVSVFLDEDFMQTKRHLQEALRIIFRGCVDVPEPPLIFISLLDTCEQILEKIQSAPVKHDHIQLELSKSVCTRCGVDIFREGKAEAKADKCVDESGSISAEESTCHPRMEPKHFQVVRALGRVLFTFGFFKSFADEECVSCRQSPGVHGCMQIGKKFRFGKEDIDVQHSTSVFEPYQVEEDEAPREDVVPREDEVPREEVVVDLGAPDARYLVYPDRPVFKKQEPDPHDFSAFDMKGT